MRCRDHIVSLQRNIDRIEDLLNDRLPEKPAPRKPKRVEEDIPETSVSITWIDKTKGLIVCNKCGGTGREEGNYGLTNTCRFCSGLKQVRLVDTSKTLKKRKTKNK